MKINLAENMLRFGAKNLTASSKQKLVQLAEQETPGTTDLQTVGVKPKGENKLSDGSAFNVGNTTPPNAEFFTRTGKIFYYNIGDQTLYFYSSATDTAPITLSADNTFNLNTAIDFIADLGKKSYNTDKVGQLQVANILRSLNSIQSRVRTYEGGSAIQSKISNINALLKPYGEKDFKTMQYLASHEFRGKKYGNLDPALMKEFGLGLYIWLGNNGKPGFVYDPSKPTAVNTMVPGEGTPKPPSQ
jgi:hypothetical protein